MAAHKTFVRQVSAWSSDSWSWEGEQSPALPRRRDTLPGDAQTPEFIAAWMQSHRAPGVVVVVRHRQLGIHEYLLDEMRRVDLRLKRIYLADYGTFRLGGDYLAPPQGRLSLLVPVGDAFDAAVQGQSWMHGRPAFRRPCSTHERDLISIARRQQIECS